jgi:acyl-CoA synthetase (AMP-forming)/AMP-acid ligase II/thioesterase domain-containing protein/acyl carrier protein
MPSNTTLPGLFASCRDLDGTLTILGPTPGDDDITLTQAELHHRGDVLAAGLAERGIRRGEVVAMFTRASADFIAGCLAIWRRGATVLPLPPPARLVSREAWEKQIDAALKKADARAMLTTSDDRPVSGDVPSIPVSALETSGVFTDAFPDPSDVALIQFSSGSTARPKGVVLEHRGIVSHLAAIDARIGPRPGEKGVFYSWLPLSHDLGFVNYFLLPFSGAHDLYLLPTETFLGSPLRWVEDMSRYSATICSGPNMAFGLVARELEKAGRMKLDLSSWLYAGNGGEMVAERTMARFVSATARYGLPAGTVSPGYGLAEATCTVTAKSPGRGWSVDRVVRSKLAEGRAEPAGSDGPGVATIASNGPPLDGLDLAIAGPSGEHLEERRVGELLIRGPGVMRGYLNDPEETAKALRDGWLRTGDLAYLVDGEVFITGRRKDIIVVGGRNLNAEAVEAVVQDVSGVRAGNCVAFPLPLDDSEGLAVLAETNGDPEEAAGTRLKISEAVVAEIGVAPSRIVMLPPRSVPKTTSGKLQRKRARELFESGALVDLAGNEAASTDGPGTEMEARLAPVWESVLGIERISPLDDFFLLGGTSMQAATLVVKIERELGRPVPLSLLLTAPSIRQMAALLEAPGPASHKHLLALQTDNNELPFFCVHGGGGDVFRFIALARNLAGWRPFFGIQARGLDGNEPPHRSIEEMAAHYVSEVRRSHEGPYLLLGYSFGGVVAYEMAAQLERSGERVSLLGVLDAPGPATTRGPNLRSGWKKGPKVAFGYARNIVQQERTHLRAKAYLALRRPVPSALITDFMMVNSGKVMSRYRGGGYSGTVDYFRVVDESGEPLAPRSEGWERVTGGRLRVRDVRGPNHVEVLEEPWVKGLAQALGEAAEDILSGDDGAAG